MSDMPFLEISGEINPSVEIHQLEKALRVFCAVSETPENIEVSLVFCSSDMLRKINRIYRGTDKTTDVLSFPAEGINLPGIAGTMEPLFLGEILLDLEYITENLEHRTLQEDIMHTFIHGLLHLAGYDHIGQSDSIIMQKQENKILNLLRLDGNCE